MSDRPIVCLNRFSVYPLDSQARTVARYGYSFSAPPEGPDIYRAVGSILYKIGRAVGARLGSEIVTTTPIAEAQLQGDGWSLNYIGDKVLDPAISVERKALGGLHRRHLHWSLRQLNGPQVEKSGSGFVLWDDTKVKKQGNGWQVLKGALVDVAVDDEGLFSLEIDTHYRFYSPWTVQEWLDNYPEVPLSFVRNVSDGRSWYFVKPSAERPEDVQIKALGKTLAEYHRSLNASEQAIQTSSVVYVRHTTKGNWDNDTVPHLSQLLSPCLSTHIPPFELSH